MNQPASMEASPFTADHNQLIYKKLDESCHIIWGKNFFNNMGFCNVVVHS
jgi:hypothetical protein